LADDRGGEEDEEEGEGILAALDGKLA